MISLAVQSLGAYHISIYEFHNLKSPEVILGH
jgi:hypothetical protein